MTLDDYLKTIVASTPQDWSVVTRPTLRHQFTRMASADGDDEQIELGEPPAVLGFKRNLSISLLVGAIEQAKYKIPVTTPFSEHNARTLLADCLYDGILVHREVLVSVDRQHCILPLPSPWTQEKQPISVGKVAFAQLIHELVGPFIDFGEYFDQSGMVPSELPWPEVFNPAKNDDASLDQPGDSA